MWLITQWGKAIVNPKIRTHGTGFAVPLALLLPWSFLGQTVLTCQLTNIIGICVGHAVRDLMICCHVANLGALRYLIYSYIHYKRYLHHTTKAILILALCFDTATRNPHSSILCSCFKTLKKEIPECLLINCFRVSSSMSCPCSDLKLSHRHSSCSVPTTHLQLFGHELF